MSDIEGKVAVMSVGNDKFQTKKIYRRDSVFWIPASSGFRVLRSCKKSSCVETPSLPTLRRCYPRSFAFYLGKPISSIPDLKLRPHAGLEA